MKEANGKENKVSVIKSKETKCKESKDKDSNKNNIEDKETKAHNTKGNDKKQIIIPYLFPRNWCNG